MTAPAARPVERSKSRGAAPWAAWLLRSIVLLNTVLVFLQPVTAGLFVTGEVGYLDLHSLGHLVILGVTSLQVIVAILAWRPGRAPGWPIWASVALWMLIEMQAGFGFTRDLSLHIPGGVLIFGLMIAMLIGIWAKVTIRSSDKAPADQSGEPV